MCWTRPVKHHPCLQQRSSDANPHASLRLGATACRSTAPRNLTTAACSHLSLILWSLHFLALSREGCFQVRGNQKPGPGQHHLELYLPSSPYPLHSHWLSFALLQPRLLGFVPLACGHQFQAQSCPASRLSSRIHLHGTASQKLLTFFFSHYLTSQNILKFDSILN